MGSLTSTSINKKLNKAHTCTAKCPVLSCLGQDRRTEIYFSSCPARSAGQASWSGRQDRINKVVLCSSLAWNLLILYSMFQKPFRKVNAKNSCESLPIRVISLRNVRGFFKVLFCINKFTISILQ